MTVTVIIQNVPTEVMSELSAIVEVLTKNIVNMKVPVPNDLELDFSKFPTEVQHRLLAEIVTAYAYQETVDGFFKKT